MSDAGAAGIADPFGAELAQFADDPERKRYLDARLNHTTDSLPNSGGRAGGFGVHFLRSSAKVIAAEAKRQIDAHVEKTKQNFDDAVTDPLTKILANFDKRDKNLAQLLAYVYTRENAALTGANALQELIVELKAYETAKKKNDVVALNELQKRFRAVVDTINRLLIGLGNPNAIPLDADRLLGEYRGGAYDPLSSATSTGHAP